MKSERFAAPKMSNRRKTNNNISNRRGRASISSLNRIKKGFPLGGGDNRCNTRIGVVGVSPTDIPRRGLGNQPCICPIDNLLVTDKSLKTQLIWLH